MAHDARTPRARLKRAREPAAAPSKNAPQVKTPAFNAAEFLAEEGQGRELVGFAKNETIFSQDDPANALFYIHKGKVKLSVVSNRGKEAVIALLEAGNFFGEGCLTAQHLRGVSARAISDCSIMRIRKDLMVEMLRQEPVLSELLLSYMLSRAIRIEEDLVDQPLQLQRKATGESPAVAG